MHLFIQNEADKLGKRITQLQTNPSQQNYNNCCCFGLFGRKTVDHYEKKLEDIEENVKRKQSEVSLAGEVCDNLYGLVPNKNNTYFTKYL